MKVTAPGEPLPLDSINKKIKLVVIDSPYDTIQSEETQRLLSKIVSLKIAGYKKEYPYGVLPVDTGDFVGVHLLACIQTENGLEPFMGFKSVSLERCHIHHLTFPTHHICADFKEHNDSIDRIIQTAIEKGERVAYNGSWTVDQTLRKDKAMMQLCYDLTLTLLVKYYTEYGIQNVIAGAIKKFQVEKFKEFMGFHHVQDINGVQLPPIPCIPFNSEPLAVMHLHDWSEAAKALAKRYDGLWKSRLTIEHQENVVPLKKVA